MDQLLGGSPGNGPGDYTWYWNGININVNVFGVYTFAFLSPSVGDKLRIRRYKSQVIFEHLPVGTVGIDSWDIIYTTTPDEASSGNYYPRVAANAPSLPVTFKNTRISNPQYDNWFIQHAIPQSDLQYAWINDSYNSEVDQPWGHAGSPDCGRTSFSVPSGSINSITASVIQFVNASSWDFEGIADGDDYAVNFVNMLPMLPTTVMSPRDYKYILHVGDDNDLVDWYNKVNVTSSDGGRVLTRGPGNPYWDSGAAGRKLIYPGGYVEMEIVELTNVLYSSVIFGLDSNPGADATHYIKYSIKISPSSKLQVWEDGVTKGDQGLWAAGDKIRVRITNNDTVEYQHSLGDSGDFNTIYVSETPPSVYGNLRLDIAIWGTGDSARDLRAVGNAPTSLIAPGHAYFAEGTYGTIAFGAINSYFNNLNGPYQYPSWKQIRTGEHPVARYQKKIITS